MKTKVMTFDAKAAGDIDLKDDIYGLEPRADILARVVAWQLAKRRAGSAKTLKRGEISKTTKKWGNQKGGGTARHGARSAPQFKGGGRAMGPQIRSHEYDLPKKIRTLGLKLALSTKAKESKIIVIEEAVAKEIKTSAIAKSLGKLGADKALIVDGAFDEKFSLSARNLAHVALLPASGLNVYDILKNDTLVLTKAAVKAIEERLG